MPKKSLKYTACHEAGHAVVALQNGFEIHSILLSHDSILDSWSGVVNYEPVSWQCPECDTQLMEAIRGEDFAKLNPECKGCAAKTLSFTMRCLAGGVATELIEPVEHTWEDSGCDRIEAFKCSAPDTAAREENYERWLEVTRGSVCRFRNAIQTLQERLIESPIRDGCIKVEGGTVAAVLSGVQTNESGER